MSDDVGVSVFEDRTYLESLRRDRVLPQALRSWYVWDALRLLEPRRHLRILDVGAGTGQFLAAMCAVATTFATDVHITLLDTSEAMHQELTRQAGTTECAVEVVHGGLEALPSGSAYDFVFMSESLHLLGPCPALMRAVSGLLAEQAVLGVRVATREQISHRRWFSWFPEARDIEMARHPSGEDLLSCLVPADLDGRLHRVDESRWVDIDQARRLLQGRAFSSLHLVDEGTHNRRAAQFFDYLGGRPRLWFDYEMTWLVARPSGSVLAADETWQTIQLATGRKELTR